MKTVADFPLQTYDKVRYADTDRQGHVNSAAFSSFCETGRVEFLYDPEIGLLDDGCSFVIASLKLDYLAEARWPGRVEIGTAVSRIGNSSMTLVQLLMQGGVPIATSETVIVQVDDAKGGGRPLTASARETLQGWLVEEG